MILLQADAPFFPNNLEGALKVGGMLAVLIGSMFAIMRGPLNRRIEEVDKQKGRDIDGVGGRATLLEARTTALEAAVGQLNQDKRADEVETRALHAMLGEVKGEISGMRSRAEETNLELIAHIHQLGTEMRQSASQTRETVAMLQGKVDTLGTFAELLAKQRQ